MSTKTNSQGKPIQIISWAEKIKEDFSWFKQNAKYFIQVSRFGSGQTARSGKNYTELYNVYNSKFPEAWFTQHTNPLNATKEEHKRFPAKIRPINILRPNLDLLISEYPRRPFEFFVTNLSDDAYSSFQEEVNNTVMQNLTQHFQGMLAQSFIENGLLTPEGEPVSEEAAQQVQQQMESLELPEKVRERAAASFKDKLAIKGQKYVKRIIKDEFIKAKLLKCFKHWMIAGETYSYKTVEHGKVFYKAISPPFLDYDKSPDTDMVEDGDWAVYRDYMTLSDVVDLYYEDLKEKEVKELQSITGTYLTSPSHLYNHLLSEGDLKGDKLEVYHIVWKGKKKIHVLQTEDGPMPVDEDYPLTPEEKESAESFWVNEIYEITQITPELFVRARPFPYQRNSMNNFSRTKLPYNGRKYSDLHSENISVLEMGLPLQILYIIITWTLERTLAKSKGKIALIDQNVIPRGEGWTEEKFFYYSDALGYALINRNQLGADKSFNQYTVLDLTLFDSIRQLIELQQHIKQEWDDLIGINRQRKGQTYASDLVGNNERATFQSTVMTDMIFNLFDEFVERELQGILDLSRFTALDGVYKVWNESDMSTEILQLDPVEYCYADLGLYMESSADIIIKKNKIESIAQAMMQNNVKASAIISLFKSDNIAEIEAKIKHIEEIQQQIESQIAESEEEAENLRQERVQAHEQFLEILRRGTMHEEYDRKEDLEHIQGTYNTFTFQNGDANANGVADAKEANKILLEREKMLKDSSDKKEQRKHDMQIHKDSMLLKEKEMKSKEKIAKRKPKKS
jgi:hypothetical protein